VKRLRIALIACALIAAVAWVAYRPKPAPRPDVVAGAFHIATRHFAITSTADAAKTRLVAERVESLRDAWVGFFGDTLGRDRDRAGLQLILYRDRAEFEGHNDSEPWAEAFYRPPACRAYFQSGAANPYHWMLHEVVHQLNDQVAHLRLRRWVNEGLASYFGSSAIEDGKLRVGEVDPNTYPIWWVTKMELSGNLKADIASGRIIPLRKLITEPGPLTAADDVNLHYIEYWSLTHFLIHHDHGKYAAGFRRVIAEGGSLEAFEARIGPLEAIEPAWYAYLRGQVDALSPTLIR